MAEEVNATVHKQALASPRLQCLETCGGEGRWPGFKWSSRVSERSTAHEGERERERA